MSTALGHGISRTASNQYVCDICGGYTACVWATKFEPCTCPDIDDRWRRLHREMGDPKDIHFNSHGGRRVGLTAGLVSFKRHLAQRHAANTAQVKIIHQTIELWCPVAKADEG
jgi:hypothetical protein